MKRRIHSYQSVLDVIVKTLVLSGLFAFVSSSWALDVSKIQPEDFDPYPFRIVVVADYEIHRSGKVGDRATMVIKQDGRVVLKRNAASDLRYTYFCNRPGSTFEVHLEQLVGRKYQRVSNIVRYTAQLRPADAVPPALATKFTELPAAEAKARPYKLAFMPDGHVQRSGKLGERLVWVVEQNGKIVLQRNASRELKYKYVRNLAGNNYGIHLRQFIDGYYKRVSNLIEYEAD